MYSSSLLVFVIAFAAALVGARTDLSGCVSSQTVRSGGASLLWYVPGTGEVCEFLDCGGGRAAPKTTVPGCPSYQGTETYSPSFIVLAASTTASPSSATESSSSLITDAPVLSSTASTSTSTSTSPSLTSSSTATAPISSSSGNAASVKTLNRLAGVAAAGLAFVLN